MKSATTYNIIPQRLMLELKILNAKLNKIKFETFLLIIFLKPYMYQVEAALI